MGQPAFSVLLPTRNRLALLKEAIETVRRQNYSDWEIVIADNASTDDIAGFVDELKDPRLIFLRSEVSLSVTENWNRAIDAARGNHIVMLGDDDGLTPGYFVRCAELVDRLEDPDFIYHGAFHFHFPGVIRENPNGAIINATDLLAILRRLKEPTLMPVSDARETGRLALKFRARYGFNMQYFLFKRCFLEEMCTFGPIFQGPFPDFYAANLAMLIGNKIGLVPEPLTVIGISPKSYGNFHFNGREDEGIAFLNIQNYVDLATPKVSDVLLPGSHMNSCWLLSVARVSENLGNGPEIQVDIARYRRLQVNEALYRLTKAKGNGLALAKRLWPTLLLRERIYLVLWGIAFACARPMPNWFKRITVGLSKWHEAQYGRYLGRARRHTEFLGATTIEVFKRMHANK